MGDENKPEEDEDTEPGETDAQGTVKEAALNKIQLIKEQMSSRYPLMFRKSNL
jgi:hypothetical protein